jgi:DNA-binding MarR family transcriptional regulator
MNSTATGADAARAERMDYVAGRLLSHAALLTRLIANQVPGPLSRTEAGVLYTLADAPRRITELAELEGLAQPTMTLLLQRLEQRGWVQRARHPDDGRAVLVSVTAPGRAMLDDFRARVALAVRADMEGLSDEQIEALEAATHTLRSLIDVLQGAPALPRQ